MSGRIPADLLLLPYLSWRVLRVLGGYSSIPEVQILLILKLKF
jgi:hypothetical protein